MAHGKAFELHSEGTGEALEDLGKRVKESDMIEQLSLSLTLLEQNENALMQSFPSTV